MVQIFQVNRVNLQVVRGTLIAQFNGLFYFFLLSRMPPCTRKKATVIAEAQETPAHIGYIASCIAIA